VQSSDFKQQKLVRRRGSVIEVEQRVTATTLGNPERVVPYSILHTLSISF